MIGAAQESPRPQTGDGFSDVVAFAFGDAAQELYGMARIEFAPTAYAAAALFSQAELVTERSASDVAVQEPAWESIEVAGVRFQTLEPLRRWRLGFSGEDANFELEFSALGEALELGPEASSGLAGYEQLCLAQGQATVSGRERAVRALGQRGHRWGRLNWKKLERVTTVSAWLGEDRAIALETTLPRGARGHDAGAIAAMLLEESPEESVSAQAVADPRLSTTFDRDGRALRAGVELWLEDEDELPRRAAGEALCATTLELGDRQLECAFFAWRMEGREGVGRYDVLHEA